MKGTPGVTGSKKEFPPLTFEKICTANLSEAFKTGKEDHYYALSVRTTVFAVITLQWFALFLSVPAILQAKKAQELDQRGDVEEALKKAAAARKLNIAAIIVGFINAITIFTTPVVAAVIWAVIRYTTFTY